jgi:hypothetical protein
MNWFERLSSEDSSVAVFSPLIGQSRTTFLQQVGLDSLFTVAFGLLRAKRLATNAVAIIPGMIQYFFCISAVFGWDENSLRNVTANLKMNFWVSNRILTKGRKSMSNSRKQERPVRFLQELRNASPQSCSPGYFIVHLRVRADSAAKVSTFGAGSAEGDSVFTLSWTRLSSLHHGLHFALPFIFAKNFP